MKVNDPICKFSVDVVPYLYGELSSRHGSDFESHLLDCGACTDEFAEISAARFEVYEWKKLEFDKLPTPVVHVPYGEPPVAASWLQGLRERFAGGWAIPSVAFGALALVVFGMTFVLWSDSGNYVAQTDPDVAPARVNDAAPEAPAAKPVIAQQPREGIEQPESKRRTHPARMSAPTAATRNAAPSFRVSPRLRSVEASVQTPRRSTPTLNGYVEDEDNSLRLAELFEDIDTSD